jgi:fructose-1,6-bisphosphatase/sedoheptulose 1,7-bisphosphatase-like protein
MYWSIGGSPEAVIAACAMKCMGGFLQCQEVQKEKTNESPGEIGKIRTDGIPLETWSSVGDPMLIEDLAAGQVMFAATGITNGKLFKGTRFTGRGPVTNSVAMRSESQTVRWLTTEHGN